MAIIEAPINWKGSETTEVISVANKEKLDFAELISEIDLLIDDNKISLDKHKELYSKHTDSDLASIILRFEQNIMQLQKIKYSYG